MRALQFANKAAADSVVAELDKSLGYPKAGVDVGGGTHAPPSQTITTHHAVPQKHPTLNKYIIESDTLIESKRSEVAAKVSVPATEDLDDAEWRPAP